VNFHYRLRLFDSFASYMPNDTEDEPRLFSTWYILWLLAVANVDNWHQASFTTPRTLHRFCLLARMFHNLTLARTSLTSAPVQTPASRSAQRPFHCLVADSTAHIRVQHKARLRQCLFQKLKSRVLVDERNQQQDMTFPSLKTMS
jgi:hypothetical protein